MSTPDLAERYGTATPARRRSRVAVIAAVAVLAVVGVVWLVWVMLAHGRPLVQSDMVSFETRGQHAVDARFTVVRRSTDVEASCLLRAYASDHTIVGELNVPVGPEQPATATLDATVRTERLATSVDTIGCTAPGQTLRR
ncbi:DUF4307 domain-containing protein [Nocardioides mesophilus]|uniref:DUF4307 domain-containing protein n=1 Tax=Nocardioides mesophilus TaxID=433659 RepID=A0A7G9R7S2_9ACTN|nr:DUF4307 domain-containing protein [Nocardioides mesophilus]QNN51647.1 DUF4307 domain-containing protein [Nocardioides mesophilus]